MLQGKDPCWGSLQRTVSYERDITLELWKSVRCPPPEEEGATETTCDELTITPIPRSGGGGREKAVKLIPGKKRGVGGKGFLRFSFISHCPTLI